MDKVKNKMLNENGYTCFMEFPCTANLTNTQEKVKHLHFRSLKREPFLLLLFCAKFICNIENDFSFQAKKEAKVQFMATEVHGKLACKRS